MPQNFYRKNGSFYNAQSNAYIGSTAFGNGSGYTEVPQPNPVGTPISPTPPLAPPTGSVAIPGGQIGNYNVTGQFGVTGQPGSGLWGTPKIPGSVNPTDTNPVVPTAPTDPTNTASYVAGLDPGLQGFQSIIDTIMAPSPAESQINPINTRINDLTQQGYQKPIDYQAELNKYGFQTNVNDLQNLNTQMASVKAQYDKLQEELKNSNGLTRIIGGSQDKLLRQSAVELGRLSSMAQALQGNITMAQSIADKTIALKYEPIEKDIANQKYQLDQVYAQLSREDKQKADALKITLDERQRKIDTQKETDKGINDVMTTAAKNGATSEVLQKIMKSKTEGEAIINSGQYMKTDTKGSWSTFKDDNGTTYKINTTTGVVQNITGIASNLGNQVGEIFGLASYNTLASNPGVTRADRNNNPGNIKVSDFTKGFSGVVGADSSAATDGGNFLIFDSPESGKAAIGQLFQQGKSYKGVTAEKAIKTWNGNGSYGAADVGLDPKGDFQTQIADPAKLAEVISKLPGMEGFTGMTPPTTTTTSDFDYAKTIIDANPGATPDELKLGLLEQVKNKTLKLSVSEINALIATVPVVKITGDTKQYSPIDEVKIKAFKDNGEDAATITSVGFDKATVDKVFAANPAPKSKISQWWDSIWNK